MTLIQIIDQARALAGEPLSATRSFPDNTSSYWADQTLVNYFNQVQSDLVQDIVQANEDFFTTHSDLNITDGCDTYAIPSGTLKVRRVENIRNDTNNPTEIRPVTLNNRDIASDFGPLIDAGSPANLGQGYYLRGTQLVLTETPTFTDTAAIRLWFVRQPGDICAGTSISAIPVEHHRVAVWGLLEMMQTEQQGDTKDAVIRYERGRLNMIKQVENRQTQRPKRVRRSNRRVY